MVRSNAFTFMCFIIACMLNYRTLYLFSIDFALLTVIHVVPSEPTDPSVMTIPGSPTQLLVMWGPPAEPNGMIISYTVNCYESLRSSGSGSGMETPSSELANKTLISMIVFGNQSQATVTDLEPYTYYECYITAATSVGVGNASVIKSIRTDESSRSHNRTA